MSHWKLYIFILDFQFLITYFHQRRANLGLSYMIVLEHLKKQCDYVGENFFVSILPLKCNDTGIRCLHGPQTDQVWNS